MVWKMLFDCKRPKSETMGTQDLSRSAEAVELDIPSFLDLSFQAMGQGKIEAGIFSLASFAKNYFL